MASAATERHQWLPIMETASPSFEAAGSKSSKRSAVVSKQRPKEAIRTGMLGLRGRSQQALSTEEALADSGTGFLTIDESDVSSESTTSSIGSEDDSRPEGETLPPPPTVVGRSGCLKVPTQKMSLTLKYGKKHLETLCSTSSKKSLSWNTVEIFTHEVILGDNPAVTLGPPLSIGWEVWEKACVPLEDYEAYRPERRSALNLRMSRSERERLLMQEFGVTRSHIREVTELMNKIRLRRNANSKRTLSEVLRDCFNSRRSVMRRSIREKP